MADGTIAIDETNSDKLVDTTALTVGANTVQRERVVIAGAAAAELADVKAATPTSGLYGVVVREVTMGEVQATPTSNTVLGRLKDLLTGIVLSAGAAVIGKVRLVTANGDEITDDTADAIKAKLSANSGVDIGDVDVASIAAGDNNIGNVDIASAIPAGTNNIGDVDVTTDPVYGTIACGELAGSATALQFPSQACRGVYLKASGDNSGKVYVGGSGVTVADGTTDTTTGIQLAAGDSIYIPVSNLNVLYRICDNAGDDLTYLALVS